MMNLESVPIWQWSLGFVSAVIVLNSGTASPLILSKQQKGTMTIYGDRSISPLSRSGPSSWLSRFHSFLLHTHWWARLCCWAHCRLLSFSPLPWVSILVLGCILIETDIIIIAAQSLSVVCVAGQCLQGNSTTISAFARLSASRPF